MMWSYRFNLWYSFARQHYIACERADLCAGEIGGGCVGFVAIGHVYLVQTAGNLNVVSVMWGDTTSSVSSVTDSKGNSYALALGPSPVTGSSSTIYYAKNIAAGSNTVTVNFNPSAAFPNVTCWNTAD